MSQSKNTPRLLLIALLFVSTIGLSVYFMMDTSYEMTSVAEVAAPAPEPILSLEERFPYVINPRSTLYEALNKLGVAPQLIHQIVLAAKPVVNLSRLPAGVRFQLNTLSDSMTDLTGITFRFSPVETVEIKKENESWVAQKILEPVEIELVTFQGVVNSTLWESAEKAKMDPNLISDLAEIFAWQVDFAREVRVNDRWRLTVERKLVKGEPIGWGRIRAAEYENEGELHDAILFDVDRRTGYFSRDGSSLKKMFLKSPLKYGRISSRFQRRRFHPKLKIHRPHLGVDYAAPSGTPVRAVGDGTVHFAGWAGGGGNTIRLRHNSIYKTHYLHLSRFAKGIRKGARVQQGQVIGYVGTTGLSTGPHLHFEFFQNGRFVDPLGHDFPSADPVPKSMLAEFQAHANSLLGALPLWDNLAASNRILATEEGSAEAESF